MIIFYPKKLLNTSNFCKRSSKIENKNNKTFFGLTYIFNYYVYPKITILKSLINIKEFVLSSLCLHVTVLSVQMSLYVIILMSSHIISY